MGRTKKEKELTDDNKSGNETKEPKLPKDWGKVK